MNINLAVGLLFIIFSSIFVVFVNYKEPKAKHNFDCVIVVLNTAKIVYLAGYDTFTDFDL
jgi:hypothetical protein